MPFLFQEAPLAAMHQPDGETCRFCRQYSAEQQPDIDPAHEYHHYKREDVAPSGTLIQCITRKCDFSVPHRFAPQLLQLVGRGSPLQCPIGLRCDRA